MLILGSIEGSEEGSDDGFEEGCDDNDGSDEGCDEGSSDLNVVKAATGSDTVIETIVKPCKFRLRVRSRLLLSPVIELSAK